MVKLKAKIFDWLAGRPVIVLNEKTAKKLNVNVNDRVLIAIDHKKIHAVVDIFTRLVKGSEIGLSNELNKYLRAKKGQALDVSSADIPDTARLIKQKIEGKELSQDEITDIITEITQNHLSEAEIAYFAAAQQMKGMSKKETVSLINAMVKTGKQIKFKQKLVADKHCIGGIAGNRTTPIVVSICAAAGLTFPKTSSKAITSASGTADVIETIAKIEFSAEKLKKIVNKTGGILAWGGSLNLAPSDDKIIHVERILNLDAEPQLLASILSKKISVGSKYVLIDIPYGKSAKIDTLKEAKELGKKFEQLGRKFKMKVKSIYTNGIQPIGYGIGPVLEMKDVMNVLENKMNAPKDLREKSLYLSTEIMKLCGLKNAKKKAEEILDSGKALDKFKEIINTQNGKKDFDERVKKLKLAKHPRIIRAKYTGKIKLIDNKKINSLCRILGTPETKGAGIYLNVSVGDKIKKGDTIMTMYSESRRKLREAKKYLEESEAIKI